MLSVFSEQQKKAGIPPGSRGIPAWAVQKMMGEDAAREAIQTVSRIVPGRSHKMVMMILICMVVTSLQKDSSRGDHAPWLLHNYNIYADIS